MPAAERRMLEATILLSTADIIKTIRKRRFPPFYFPKDTFDSVPISVWKHLKPVAVFIENIHQVISVVDEKFDIIEPIASVELG